MATLQSHQHGKSKVRVGRVWRPSPSDAASNTLQHTFAEYEVDTMLESDMAHAYTTDSNKGMTATDTQKNTVYYVAKQLTSYSSPEQFALAIGSHFVKEYPLVSRAKITVKLLPWSRYHNEHHHGFVHMGSQTRTARVVVSRGAGGTCLVESVVAGVSGMKILKTTQSGYAGFLHDAYTVLPDTHERILATSMASTWSYSTESLPRTSKEYDEIYAKVLDACLETFFGPPQTGVYSPSVQYTLYQMGKRVIQVVPQVSSIYFSLPNLHFIPCNVVNSKKGFEDDVYVATREPHGTIEAVVTRNQSGETHCKL
jgi:urate oxidase